MDDARAAVIDVPAPDPSDPINEPVGPASAWTRTNTAEAFPGVLTPLGWTFAYEPLERAFREGMVRIGVLPASEREPPRAIDLRFIGAAHYGRLAISIDAYRNLADRMPGNSGDAFERQFFGSVRPGVTSTPVRGRLLHAITNVLPRLIATTRGSVAALREGEAAATAWWKRSTDALSGATPNAALALLHEARAQYRHWAFHSAVVSMVSQGLYERVTKACTDAGSPGLETALLANREPSHEARTVEALWNVSRGRATTDAFLGEFGFHGPAEGLLQSRSWREARAPVEALLATYRDMAEEASPAAQRGKLLERRAEAEAKASAFPLRQRMALRALLPMTRALLLRREASRIMSHVQCNDVARGAARVLGREWARRGWLADEEDVFHLTFGELTGAPPPDSRNLATLRRARWSRYDAIDLPMRWIGPASPQPRAGASTATTPIAGTGASPGVVEARACVVLDPAEADDFEPGDVLVCQTTDPGWAALFVVASAVVIDIGGTMSHGAIVARELGLPCVIGTGDGTRRIRTGMRLRVDGGAGNVTLLPQ